MRIKIRRPAPISRNLNRLAKSLVEVCVRNSSIEDLHAGIFPATETGDFIPTRSHTGPFGEIPWTELLHGFRTRR